MPAAVGRSASNQLDRRRSVGLAADQERWSKSSSAPDRSVPFSCPGATIGTHQPRTIDEFSFAIRRAKGTVVVTTHGPLDLGGAAALGDALLDLVDNQGNLAVVVDLTDMQVQDDTVLDALVPAASAATRRGGRLTLADPSDDVAWGLLLSGVTAMVTVTNGRRTAIALHPAGSGRPPTPVHPTTQGATR